jgi:hypothetical protein
MQKVKRKTLFFVGFWLLICMVSSSFAQMPQNPIVPATQRPVRPTIRPNLSIVQESGSAIQFSNASISPSSDPYVTAILSYDITNTSQQEIIAWQWDMNFLNELGNPIYYLDAFYWQSSSMLNTEPLKPGEVRHISSTMSSDWMPSTALKNRDNNDLILQFSHVRVAYNTQAPESYAYRIYQPAELSRDLKVILTYREPYRIDGNKTISLNVWVQNVSKKTVHLSALTFALFDANGKPVLLPGGKTNRWVLPFDGASHAIEPNKVKELQFWWDQTESMATFLNMRLPEWTFLEVIDLKVK